MRRDMLHRLIWSSLFIALGTFPGYLLAQEQGPVPDKSPAKAPSQRVQGWTTPTSGSATGSSGGKLVGPRLTQTAPPSKINPTPPTRAPSAPSPSPSTPAVANPNAPSPSSAPSASPSAAPTKPTPGAIDLAPSLMGGKPTSGKTPAKDASGEDAAKGAALVPPGQELVSMDFPEMTDIQDIIKAVDRKSTRLNSSH